MLGSLSPGPAEAWDRGDVDNFATIPTFAPSGPGAACPNGAKSCTSDVEGVAVAPDGTVYSASYGFNSDGALGGYGELLAFNCCRGAGSSNEPWLGSIETAA